MKRFIIPVIMSGLLAMLAGLTAACQPSFQPGTFTDDMNRPVNIREAPKSIVSHVPSITETLFALGLGGKVVGRSDFDDFPEEAASIPSVGNYFNPSIEKIVALKPDLVLTDGHSENIKQLDSLGITYMVIDPKNIDDIYEAILLLGKVTGTESNARKLVDDMKKTVADVVERVKGAPKVRVIDVIDATDLNNPWTVGPGSFVDALITMAGGENIAGKAPAAFTQMSVEQIISADPEIIILPGKHGTAFSSPEAFKEHPAWQKTSAVRNGKILVIDADLVDRSGPRIVQGLEEIARVIHPELFK